MTTFRTLYLTCPNCSCQIYNYELGSYLVLNSTVFSDGKTEYSPLILFDEEILICSNCKKEFWKEDALINDNINNFNEDNLPKAMDIYDLHFALDSIFPFKFANYYKQLLNNGFANTKKREILLRIKLWHLLNDKIRNSSDICDLFFKGEFIKFISQLKSKYSKASLPKNIKILFKENLHKLIEIYKPTNDDEQLMLAEMHREIENFSEATSILNEIEDQKNNKTLRQIANAIKKKKTKVFILKK